jgi:hypothetical protein
VNPSEGAQRSANNASEGVETTHVLQERWCIPLFYAGYKAGRRAANGLGRVSRSASGISALSSRKRMWCGCLEVVG